MVTLDYVLNRYNTSLEWITKHGNAVIGNGPYYLEEFNPAGGVVTLSAFRDGTYPIEVGSYSKFVNPPGLDIRKINVPKFIQIGKPFDFSIEMGVKNSSGELNPFIGSVNYIVTDRNDNLVIADKLTLNASKDVDNSFDSVNSSLTQTSLVNIHLNSTQTSELVPGPSKLKLIITTFDSPKPTISENTLIARP